MFDNFGLEINTLLKDAENERNLLNHPYVGSEHLLLSILKNNKEISNVFKDYNITYTSFKKNLINIVGVPKKNIEINLYTPLLKRIIANAYNDAKENNNSKITVNHLLIALLEEGEGVAIRILFSENVDLDDIYKKIKKTNNKEITENIFGGKNLNKHVDFTEYVIGREKEINFIIETLLRKKKNNPLLIGEAGVGKTAIVEELARRIVKGNVPNELKGKTIISLEMASLVAGTKYRGEFEEKLTKIIEEIENRDDIILFIDEIHTMVSAGGAEGAISAGDIFKPYLARSKVKCIGSTTTSEYEKYIMSDKALSRRFENILIKEPTDEETINILKNIKKEYENHHNVIIPNNIINEIVDYSSSYLKNKKNPDKSIDLLDSVCTSAKLNNFSKQKNKILFEKQEKLRKEKEKAIINNDFNNASLIYQKEKVLSNKLNNLNKKIKITKKDIINVLNNKIKIPKFVFNKEIDILKLKNKIIGQDKHIENIIDLIIKHNFKTSLNILINGQSGCGKTEFLNQLTSQLKEFNIVNINLKNYQTEYSFNNFKNILIDNLKYYPFSIIIFDNINYAIEPILNEINKIITKCKIKYNDEELNFNNSIIFFTTNERVNKLGFNNDNNINLNNEIYENIKNIIYFNEIDKSILENYIKINHLNDDLIESFNYKKYGLKGLIKN